MQEGYQLKWNRNEAEAVQRPKADPDLYERRFNPVPVYLISALVGTVILSFLILGIHRAGQLVGIW